MGNSLCCVGNGGHAFSGDTESICCIPARFQFRLQRISSGPGYGRRSQDIIISPDHDLSYTQRTSNALLIGQDEIVPTWRRDSQVNAMPVLRGTAETVEETKTLIRNEKAFSSEFKNLAAALSSGSAADGALLPIVDDDGFCPTCLDDYDSDNPKIVTQCKHHYHLPCILEWLERSKTCPVCNKEMIFNEQS